MTHQRFTAEVAVTWSAGIAHWFIVHYPHITLAGFNTFIGTLVNLGLAITTILAVISTVNKWFKKPPAPPAPGAK